MTADDGGAPVLVLGPLLRYVDQTASTIWVETNRTVSDPAGAPHLQSVCEADLS